MLPLHGMYGYWTPAIDIYKAHNTWLVYVELPGLSSSDIELNILSDGFVIKGTRMSPEKGLSAEKLEIFTGTFHREIHLPGKVDIPGVTASMKNGILCIKLPELNQTSIRISVSSSGETSINDKGE
ncbi:MAG: Hsp20/alpha crystallin family protein [Candidatus Fermentibacteraceae bacterium]|nr:Hsp20/alpha crystallin family protein [Candidatus Fermentibacteraceae bacterium]